MVTDTTTNPELQFGVRGRMRMIRNDQVIPQGAIRMSQHEVAQVQLAKIERWKPTADVWPFKYGDLIFGTSTLCTTLVISRHFRKLYRLDRRSFLLSYFVTVALPSIFSPFLQKLFVLPDVLAISSCPTCIEVRSGLVHTVASSLYPVAPAVLSSIITCKKYETYLGRDGFHPGLGHALKSSFAARNVALFFVIANFGVGFMLTYHRGRTLDLMLAKEAEHLARKQITTDDL